MGLTTSKTWENSVVIVTFAAGAKVGWVMLLFPKVGAPPVGWGKKKNKPTVSLRVVKGD